MPEIIKLDDLRNERISLLVHDLKAFTSSDNEFMGYLQSSFTGKESVDFYKGLVTANDYAAGMERNANPEITESYTYFFMNAIMPAYVLKQVTDGKRNEFSGEQKPGPFDKPLTEDRIKKIVPSDCIYDYSELFMGDKSDEFYKGLVKGFDHSTFLAQNNCKNTNTHLQLDLITMFVAYKILEKLGEKPNVEVLSPSKWRPILVTDNVIGYEER